MWASNQIGHEGELEDVLFGLALIMVTTCRDKDSRVFGHVGYEVAVAEGVRPEAGRTVGHMGYVTVGGRCRGSGKGTDRVGG
jgi:hypothetical protein